jgi:hypothetical protein
VGPRAGLDDIEKRKFLTLPGLELRPVGRPARNQSLYQLRYPRFPEKLHTIGYFITNADSVLMLRSVVCYKNERGLGREGRWNSERP